MKEIKIEFETITPIWTGDAWGENSELKATAIMGSLRFWFEVYCHFAGIEVKEKEELNYKEFIKKRREDLDKKDFEILDEMGITLSSQIFGCTGWKSRIEIREIYFKTEKVNKNDIDFTFLHENEENDTEWWCDTILFGKRKYINAIKNIKVTFIISKFYLKDFRKFLKFYQNRAILLGGKKAFGLGFVKLKSNQNLNNIKLNLDNNNYVIWDKIENVNNKNVLGYNIKHYLRRKEDKKFRAKNFGKMSQASNYYFSSIVDNSCYIITFNNNDFILNKYKNWLSNNNNSPSEKAKKSSTQKNRKTTIDDLKNYLENR